MAWFGARARAGVGLCLVVALMSACGGSKPQPNTAASAGSDSSSSKAGPAEIGKAAPDLEIQTLNGKGPLKLDSLAGQIVVVDFWAMWCGPCKQSMPKLEEIAKQNVGKVQVIGISVDDKQDGVADFAKSAGVTFPIAWDDGHTIANRWKVDSMPTTYILDGTGTVRPLRGGTTRRNQPYHPGVCLSLDETIFPDGVHPQRRETKPTDARRPEATAAGPGL